MPRRPLLLTVSALALGLVACAGSDTLTADEVATKAEDALEEELGARPEINCPDSLEVAAGEETRCTATVEGVEQEYGVTVTVTSAEGNDFGLAVEVDKEPVGGGQ